MNRHPNARRMAVVAACTSLFLLPVAWTGGREAAPSPAAQATPVTIAVVRAMNWPDEVQAQGAIAAWQEAVLAARVPGIAVTEILAAVGDRVKRGKVLARLDDRALIADMERARAEQARAVATLNQAEAEARRTDALKAGGSASDQEWLAAQTSRDLARAQFAAAEASVRALAVKLEDTQVRATDDGLIVARQAVIGQVPPLGAELFRLIRQERLEWRAEMNAEQLAQLGRLRPGAQVALRLPDGQLAAGRLRQLAGALEASNRLGVAYVDVLPGSSAKAGMVAAGTFALPGRPGLVVPAAALQVRDGRSVVFRAADGVARLLPVQTGRRQGDEIEVRGALRDGEAVVLQGAGFLRDGDAVRTAATAKRVGP